MAGRLDKMLQPGERVVYRLPGSAVWKAVAAYAIVFGPPVLLLLLLLLLLTEAGLLVSLGFVALLSYSMDIHKICVLLYGTARRAVVTDRRVIWWQGVQGRRPAEIPIGQVRVVEQDGDTITLFKPGGEFAELLLPWRADAIDFAAAAAQPAGAALRTD